MNILKTEIKYQLVYEESRTALVDSRHFRFLGISIFTVTIIETIIFYSDTGTV